jgi:LysR family transcriptional regulator, nod-box dependent transcriptional activator
MNLDRFDLNLLRALDALLAERNVTRAAERLFVTQQATSGALHRLRGHFHDELLMRVGRNLELTPLARSLVTPVREALLASQAVLDTRPSFDPTAARKNYRIAMSDYGLLVMLPRLLRRLANAAPLISYSVEMLGKESFHRVDMGELDFCMTAHDMRLYGTHRASSQIHSIPMFRDDFVCVLDVAHSGTVGSLSLDDYMRLRHNSVDFGHGLMTIVERAWESSGLDIDVAVKAPSFSAQIFMLPGTPMVATAQRRLAMALAPGLGLSILECPLPIPTLQEQLSWHERNEQDPTHLFMVQAMKDAAADLEAELPSPHKASL